MLALDPDTATVSVSGDKNALSDVLTWLNCRVVIFNSAGYPVWWGVVDAATVSLDGVEYGLDAGRLSTAWRCAMWMRTAWCR